VRLLTLVQREVVLFEVRRDEELQRPLAERGVVAKPFFPVDSSGRRYPWPMV
jgi:hypothetical protein